MTSLTGSCATALTVVFITCALQACPKGEDEPAYSMAEGHQMETLDSGSSGGTDAAAGGSGGGVPGTGPADSGMLHMGSGLPCAVQMVVAHKCLACHSDPPVGTFMALTTQAHWQRPGTSDPSQPYFELAKRRINADDNPMPPVAAPALTAGEKHTLHAWLDQGAPASHEACEPMESPDAGIDSGEDIDTSGLECVRFTAHAPDRKDAKFKVGTVVDGYLYFGFKAPWKGTVYAVLARPIIDNEQVVHHWLLYKGNVADGAIIRTIGEHAQGELIHGWAPGGVAMDFRKAGDVSFELPADTNYGLELHYNSSDPNAMDASGVEICFQRAPTKEIATLSWLGHDQGGVLSYSSGICLEPATTWVGTCKPKARVPIHIIAQTPHMHHTGRHMKSIINGPNGSRVLHDKPFDFNYQVTYQTNETLMPGESITTTCTFSEPKCVGQATTKEMCYNFVYAYPKGALTDNGPEGSLMHGENTCLGR